MYYVMCNDKQDMVIVSSTSSYTHHRNGYWIATIGTLQECRDFINE